MMPAPPSPPSPPPSQATNIPAGSPWAPPPAPQPATSYPQPAGPHQPAYPPAAQPWGYTGPTGYHQAPTHAQATYAQYGQYPQYQQYGQYPQAPGAHGSQASRVLIGILMVPAVIFLMIVIVKLLSTFSGPMPEPTYPPPPPPTSVTIPTATDTTPSQTPSQSSNSGYQNDGYTVPAPNLNPPDLPVPATYDQATQWMQNNAFYSQSVPSPVRCEVPNINPSTASRTQLQTYLNDIVACLMRVWAPELQAAGFNASRPSVTIYSGASQTPCGRVPRQNAFYCSADQQIYYATDLPMLFPQYKNDPFVPLSIIAHEFGHAIQAQTGILYSEAAWQQSYEDDSNTALSNEISRRTEMQADCFAGQFINSVSQSVNVSQSELTIIQKLFFAIGDDQLTGQAGFSEDHGTGANRQQWLQIGLTSSTVGACNTYSPSVTASQVH